MARADRTRSTTPSRGTLRVVAGSARGLRLDAPGGDATRPTSDRVRQSVFNSLESMGVVEGARVIDVFAGSGAMGIEALSRGAGPTTFVDSDPRAVEVVRGNLARTSMEASATVVAGDGSAQLDPGEEWDIVVLDPPYAFQDWERLLARAVGALSEQGVLVVESDREVPMPATLGVLRVKRYGGTVVTFAAATGGTC